MNGSPAVAKEIDRHSPTGSINATSGQILAIKVGGSLFSDKSVEGSLDRTVVANYARVIAGLFKSIPGKLVFISGGGAIGHGALRGIDKSDPFGCLPLTKALADVRWAWTEALVGEGVPTIPLQLGAMATLNKDHSFSIRADTVQEVLRRGALPVLSGDSVLASDGTLHGLSSDRVPEFLVGALGLPLRVVSLTDVPGILSDGPNGKETLTNVDPAHPEKAYAALWANSEWDTTGGFKTKVDALIACASLGAECFIMRGSPHMQAHHLLAHHAHWPENIRYTRIALPETSNRGRRERKA